MNFFTLFVTIWMLFALGSTGIAHAYMGIEPTEVTKDNAPVTITSPVFPITTSSGTIQAQFVAEIIETTVGQVNTVVSRTSFGQVSFANLGAPAEIGEAVRAEIEKQGVVVRENAPSIPGPRNPHANKFNVIGSKTFLTFLRIVPVGVWTIGMMQNAAHAAGQTFSMFPMESIILSPNFGAALNVGLTVGGMSALLFLTYTNTMAKLTDYRGLTGLLTNDFVREYMARHDALRRALHLPEDLQPVQSHGVAKFGKYTVIENAFYSAILYTMALNGFAMPVDGPLYHLIVKGAEFIGIGIASMDPITLLVFHVAFTSTLSSWFQGTWDLGIIRYVNSMKSKYAGDPLERGYHERVARMGWTGTSLVSVVTLALGNFGVITPAVTQVIFLSAGTVGVVFFIYTLIKYKDSIVPVPVTPGSLGPNGISGARCEGVFRQAG